MNQLRPHKRRAAFHAAASGYSVRQIARFAAIDKNTAHKLQRAWLGLRSDLIDAGCADNVRAIEEECRALTAANPPTEPLTPTVQ